MGDNRPMSSLLVVTGPPGAGKSTVARAIAARFARSVVIEGDAFFAFIVSGAIAPWLPESHQQNEVVTQASAVATAAFVRGDYTVVYDGVVGPWFLPTFAAATGLDALDYAMLLPSVERCVERVATRDGHGFTDEAATRHMHDQFARASIDPRHVLHDPPEGVDEVTDLLLDLYATGSLEHHGET
jgi:predicted ABC-type ATPase